MELLLSRLPIFDRQERIIAYEVLHHAVSGGGADPGGAGTDSEGNQDVRLLVDALLGVGLRDVAEGQPTLVSIPSSLLRDDALLQLPAAQMILGIDAMAPLAADTFDTCAALSERGFRLALLGLWTGAPGA